MKIHLFLFVPLGLHTSYRWRVLGFVQQNEDGRFCLRRMKIAVESGQVVFGETEAKKTR